MKLRINNLTKITVDCHAYKFKKDVFLDKRCRVEKLSD